MVTLQLGKVEQAEELGKLYYQCWKETYPKLIDKEYLKPITLEECIGYFKENKCKNVVEGFYNNQLVGFCTYGECTDKDVIRNTAEIYLCFVSEAYRSKGIGRKMMHQAVRELRKDDYAQLVMWCIEDHVESQSFLEALGFRNDGGRRSLENTPVVEFRYFENI